MNWKENFGKITLEKGLNYYKQNRVKIINSNSKLVEAIVNGGDNYNIRINFKEGEIKSMNCDCYFYMHETNCKHLAAVLYYLDENNNILKDNNVKDILKSVDDESINKFLLQELERDNELFIKFKIFNGLNIDNEYYLNKIRKISIDDNYFSKTMKFVDEDLEFLFENKQFELIFEIIKIIYDNIKFRVEDGEIYGDNDLVYVFDDLVFRLANTSIEVKLKQYLKNEVEDSSFGLEDEIINIASRIMSFEELFD